MSSGGEIDEVAIEGVCSRTFPTGCNCDGDADVAGSCAQLESNFDTKGFSSGFAVRLEILTGRRVVRWKRARCARRVLPRVARFRETPDQVGAQAHAQLDIASCKTRRSARPPSPPPLPPSSPRAPPACAPPPSPSPPHPRTFPPHGRASVTSVCKNQVCRQQPFPRAAASREPLANVAALSARRRRGAAERRRHRAPSDPSDAAAPPYR